MIGSTHCVVLLDRGVHQVPIGSGSLLCRRSHDSAHSRAPPVRPAWSTYIYTTHIGCVSDVAPWKMLC
jgi:hypothetical protein